MTALLVAFLVGVAVGVLAARRLPPIEHRPAVRRVDEPAARAFRRQPAPWPTVVERRPAPRAIWPSKLITSVEGGWR